MKTYSRHDVANLLAETSNIQKNEANQHLGKVLNILGAILEAGDRIEFRDFGVFEIVTRKARVGRNPAKPNSGQYLIPERKTVKFRAGKLFLQSINRPKA